MGLTGAEVAALAALVERPGAGLLIDLDGTLLDSEPVHRASFRTYFAGRGWQVDDAVIRQFSGRRAQEAFASLPGPWTGEDPDALTDGVLAALSRSPLRPVPVPGAVRLLAACARARVPLAIVTSARLDWVVPALELLAVAAGTVPVVSAEDCVRGKPDPEPFRRGAERLGLRPGGLIAVEDAPAGIASAGAAGVGRTIGITTTHPPHVLRAAGAAQTAPDLIALATAVEALGVRRGAHVGARPV